MQLVGEEKEMARAEALEAQVMETLDKEMARAKQTMKREQEALIIALEEARKITAPIRATWNVTIATNLGIMQVNAGKSKLNNQGKMQI